MAYFIIKEPNQPTKYIKEVDNANGILTFTTSKYDGAYSRSSGIIANSERDRLKFLFKKQYPELEYLEVDGYEY